MLSKPENQNNQIHQPHQFSELQNQGEALSLYFRLSYNDFFIELITHLAIFTPWLISRFQQTCQRGIPYQQDQHKPQDGTGC